MDKNKRKKNIRNKKRRENEGGPKTQVPFRKRSIAIDTEKVIRYLDGMNVKRKLCAKSTKPKKEVVQIIRMFSGIDAFDK